MFAIPSHKKKVKLQIKKKPKPTTEPRSKKCEKRKLFKHFQIKYGPIVFVTARRMGGNF